MGEGSIEWPIFDSLSAMMLTLADCYEQGVYGINNDGFLHEFVRIGEQEEEEIDEGRRRQFNQILRHHNHEVLDAGIQEIRMLETDFMLDYYSIGRVNDLLQLFQECREAGVVEFLMSVRDRYPNIPLEDVDSFNHSEAALDKASIRRSIDSTINFLTAVSP